MSNRGTSLARICVSALAIAFVLASLSYAVTRDRIAGALDSSQTVVLRGNVHSFARPQNDLGRADGSRLMEGVSIAFRPSAEQQADLDKLISELQDPASPNYQKFLTPAQFGSRFGLSRNDIKKIVAWLKSQGFRNISVANSHNEISFDGTVAQVESTFGTEMHHYLIDGDVHLANATEPSVPAALGGTVLTISHLHDFAPKPRAKVQPHLTSYVSGDHFLTPADFVTIYDLQPLYSAGADGTGQRIAIVGQSTVAVSDLNNFRTAASLPANAPTLTLIEGTATRCSGDELESDLDLEWSAGVAKNATIIFLYAGLGRGDTCASRLFNVWDAINYAVQHDIAPFISTSYGACEAANGQAFAQQVQGWAQQGITQGQTIVGPSGDSGAADCDPSSNTSASQGLAVDVPAAIPEVTGAGGTAFTGDVAGTVSGTAPNTTAAADPPYWSASGTGTDTVSSALEWIPETAWNDSTQTGGGLAASGGGASSFFAKPTWQTGTGVPADGKRDVPDISFSASPSHDPYLFCSEDNGAGGTVSTCTVGFRSGAGGGFAAVGGTSAAAPTFSAILALLNQYFGNTPPKGLAPVNPSLYQFAASNPTAFHDVTTGSNMVPCTSGTANCPSGTTKIGFNATAGYDQVTGLGSVDAFVLARAWAATLQSFTMSANPLNPASVVAGNSATSSVTITPANGFSATVTLSCSALPAGASCSFTPATATAPTWSSQMTVLTSANMAPVNGTSFSVVGTSGGLSSSATASLTVTATTETFSLTSNLSNATLPVPQGSSGQLSVTVSSSNGFVVASGGNSQTALPLNYSCSGLPSESSCLFSPGNPSSSTVVAVTVTTTPATARFVRPVTRGTRIFYAAFMPGLLGIMFVAGSRKHSLRGTRTLALILVLGTSTIWLGSCGGSNNSASKNPGTPKGSYPVTINATTGGGNPITANVSFTLTVQ
jgi:subtilase family serine protease